MQAKTRVAPVKKDKSDARQSIPRLELLAATIGVRLTSSILNSLQLRKTKIYYWTDSTTVLAWIQREPFKDENGIIRLNTKIIFRSDT